MRVMLPFLRLAAAVLLANVLAATSAFAGPAGADNGMVVTAQHLATRVGVDVLKKGGNAVDAAIAVGYALAVTYPAAGNLGGGGFMTVQLADGRRTFIDFRETAPLAATADMYLDANGNVLPQASRNGHRAVAVPGTVAGLELARTRYGTLARDELLAPAIKLADEGFVLEAGDVRLLGAFTSALLVDPPTAAAFTDGGRPFSAGMRFVQKDLARTLRDIAAAGASGFYRGRVAEAIVASSRAGGGLITQADLDAYQAREIAPLECDYRGFHIVSAPPPSSGGIVLCEMLNVLEAYPLRTWGFHSAPALHHEIEAMRHAYADRNNLLGDPDFVDNPTARLIDKRYAAGVRATIAPDRAGVSSAIRPGSPPLEGTNTTHYSIIDRAGNAVAVTYTLNNWFGAKVTAAGTGVLLNDEMDDFAAKPGVANMFGLVQGERNAIAPGKRPLSSMAPTIVTKAGKPVLVVGTPGGSRIITTVLQTIVNVIDHGMDIQQAVDAPRFHQQWQPEATSLEPGAVEPPTQRALERMGHRFVTSRPSNHMAAIIVGAPSLDGGDTGFRYWGANDARAATGLALGY